MGTSKGYIAPTRIQWTQAKRAVTQMLRNGDSDSIAKAGSKFASAMKADATSGSTFTNAATGILSLARDVANHGTEFALNQINRSDLIGKPSAEIWDELLHEYTHNGATIEDALAADALSKALENLQITDLEQLGDIPQETLLKEMLVDYVIVNFDFRYAEKIGKDRTPADAHRIMEEMQDYIKSNLYEGLSCSDIKSIDFTNLAGSEYVDKALVDAYSVFEELYTED